MLGAVRVFDRGADSRGAGSRGITAEGAGAGAAAGVGGAAGGFTFADFFPKMHPQEKRSANDNNNSGVLFSIPKIILARTADFKAQFEKI